MRCNHADKELSIRPDPIYPQTIIRVDNLFRSPVRCVLLGHRVRARANRSALVHVPESFEFRNTPEWRREALEYVGSVDERVDILGFSIEQSDVVECGAGWKSRNEVIPAEWTILCPARGSYVKST